MYVPWYIKLEPMNIILWKFRKNLGLLFVSIIVTIAFTHTPIYAYIIYEKFFFSFGYVYVKFNKLFKIKALC